MTAKYSGKIVWRGSAAQPDATKFSGMVGHDLEDNIYYHSNGTMWLPAANWADSSGTALVDPQGNTVSVAKSYTWATLPAPGDLIGLAYVPDIGARGSLWRSDGATWGIVGGCAVLSQSAVALPALPADTDEHSLVTYSLAASPTAGPLLGLDGWLEIEIAASVTNNANGKTTYVRLGSSGVSGSQLWSLLTFSTASIGGVARISARGSYASQLGSSPVANLGGSSSAISTATVDTTVDTLLAITAKKATAGDSYVLERHKITLWRP